MSKIIAAHQANFLPNLGFFYKMQQADVFVVITNLQFEKQEGWQQRNKIAGANGDMWLTVPGLGSQNQLLKDVKINDQTNWYKKHKKTFELNYAKSKNSYLLSNIKEIYDSNPKNLVEVNIKFIKLMKEALEIDTELIVDHEVKGDKHELLINICKKYGADTYLSGSGAKAYMTSEYFSKLEENCIDHKFIDNPFSNHHYSALHYILTEGRENVIQKLNPMELAVA